MPRDTKPWNHDGLASDLASHLRSDGKWITWLNFSPTGAGGSRPDILALRRFNYSSPEMVSFEIKISVSDLRSDLTSGKWQKYLDFSQAVTFAMPHGLCKAGDIPEQAGVMFRSERGWRMHRRPTLNTMKDIPIQAWLRLVNTRPNFSHYSGDPESSEHEYHAKHIERNIYRKIKESIGKRYGKDIAELLNNPERARDIINDAKNRADIIIEVARKDIEKQKLDAQHSLRDIKKILSLPEDANYADISRSIRCLRELVNNDNRMRFAISKIISAQAELNDALILERAGQ